MNSIYIYRYRYIHWTGSPLVSLLAFSGILRPVFTGLLDAWNSVLNESQM